MNASLDVKSQRLFAWILSAVACLLATGSKADERDKAEKPAADSMLGTKLGQVREDNGLKMKWNHRCASANRRALSPPSPSA